MAIHFQSIRSSSAGNCLALWTSTSSILIDCGVKVQRDCRQILEAHARRAGSLDAVIVSHAHGDHMSYAALRVLGRERIPVLADRRVIDQLRDLHDPREWKEPPRMRDIRTRPDVGHVHQRGQESRRTPRQASLDFGEGHLRAARPGGGDGQTMAVGDFRVTAIEVPHTPYVPTFGFVVSVRDRGVSRRLVFCTDFNDYSGILPRLVDADFVFVEANHDLELLRKHPNPNSHYHLNNAKTASLLHHAVTRSSRPPRAVMLGHLSEERNRRALAIGEVTRLFDRQGTRMRYHLDAAPARKPSEVIEI